MPRGAPGGAWEVPLPGDTEGPTEVPAGPTGGFGFSLAPLTSDIPGLKGDFFKITNVTFQSSSRYKNEAAGTAGLPRAVPTWTHTIRPTLLLCLPRDDDSVPTACMPACCAQVTLPAG